jgi:hypothetical protein
MHINVNTISSNLPMASNVEVFTPSTDLINYLTACNDSITWFTVIILKGLSGSSRIIF